MFSISPVKELKPARPAKAPAPCNAREFASVLTTSPLLKPLGMAARLEEIWVAARLEEIPARLAAAYRSFSINLEAWPPRFRNNPPICPILRLGIIYKPLLNKYVNQQQYPLGLAKLE